MQAQTATNQNFNVVNGNLVIVNAKLTKLDDLQD